MRRRLVGAAAVAGGALALVLVGRAYLTNVGGPAADEPAGVILAPPPDALVQPSAASSAEAAARALALLADGHPGRARVAVTWSDAGATVVLVLDREAGAIEERRGGATGTRVATVWKGAVESRLARAREAGSFDAPGLPPPERKNLYH